MRTMGASDAMERARAITAPERELCGPCGRIRYHEDGGASGLPVLLLHDVGAAGTAGDLGALFDALREHRPTIAPDLPGFGRSESPSSRIGRHDYVAVIEALILDVSRRYGATVDIVAIGATGELAATAAVHGARHVRSLTSIGARAFVPEPTVLSTLRRAIEPEGGRLARLARRALREGASALAKNLGDPDVVAGIFDEVRVPMCFVDGGGARHRTIDRLEATHGAVRRTEIGSVHERPQVERAAETAEALQAFWRTLAVKPELRVIRGEGSAGGLVARRSATLRAAPRRGP